MAEPIFDVLLAVLGVAVGARLWAGTRRLGNQAAVTPLIGRALLPFGGAGRDGAQAS